MKTLIISDTHLYHVFDKRKFFLLKKLFSSVDQVILNGDFWDGYRTTFDTFVSSPWKELFPLLKKKGAIYIYGNHDRKNFSDERTSLFSIIQKSNHLLTVDKQTYHIEHGHLLHKPIDSLYPFSKKTLYYITNVMQRFEHVLNVFGSPHSAFLKLENKKLKEKLRLKKFSHWYVCGHTHYAELDKKNKFANSGFVQFGGVSYLIVDSSGISLRSTHY